MLPKNTDKILPANKSLIPAEEATNSPKIPI
jgi:hypothetical protein